tara:strand:+ start:100 stop:480 length:381 start_codon:yes stop_codon:yes gene_type:complete
MIKLLILFLLLPAVELIVLIEIGREFGILFTLVLILTTGVLGAYLAASQGLLVLRQIQKEMSEGRFPAVTLLDGAIVLLAGLVLLTPGIVTDAIGFFCLIPTCRQIIRKFLFNRLYKAFKKNEIPI